MPPLFALVSAITSLAQLDAVGRRHPPHHMSGLLVRSNDRWPRWRPQSERPDQPIALDAQNCFRPFLTSEDGPRLLASFAVCTCLAELRFLLPFDQTAATAG